MNYTKGEWRILDNQIVTGYSPNMDFIAEFNEANDEAEANAHLIAAAPNLKEAVIRLLKDEGTSEDIAFAQDALAKAEGKVG